MPRVLLIGEYGTCNGGENSLLAVVSHLQKLGWQFIALAPTPSEFAAALNLADIETHDLSFHSNDGSRKSQNQIREELQDCLKAIDPDLVHCNSLATTRLMAPVAQKMDIPCLGYLRDILRLSKTAINDINQADCLVAVSNATRIWHIQQGVSDTKTTVIHNGIDVSDSVCHSTEPTFNSKFRDELGIPLASPLLLSVGQIGMRKGLDILLDAFEMIAKQVDTAQLIIVGERNSTKQEAINYERELLERSQTINRQLGGQKIHWLGRRNDVAEMMHLSDVLIHAARQEPLGRVLLEAASCGLPIVATNAGGTSEILSDVGVNTGNPFNLRDLIVSIDDASQIASVSVELLRDDRRRFSIGKQLLDVVQQTFSVESCANEIHHCYGRLHQRAS